MTAKRKVVPSALMVPLMLTVALVTGCVGHPGRVQGEWFDSEHGTSVYLRHDGTGTCEIYDGSTNTERLQARFSISWRKTGGRVVLEMYCRQVHEEGQECGDPGFEDFELDCELVKEAVRTEEHEDDELVCAGPEGSYVFEPLI